MKKVCFRCDVEQDLNGFYKHPAMADGHLNKCKTCTKSDTKQRIESKKTDDTWVKGEKERGRLKYHRLGYRGKHTQSRARKKETIEQYYQRYPEKKAAKSKAPPAVAGFNNHHWSYLTEHQTDVITLRVEDHYLLHRYLQYDSDFLCYRTEQGDLLDTKQKHILFAQKVLRDNGVEMYGVLNH